MTLFRPMVGIILSVLFFLGSVYAVRADTSTWNGGGDPDNDWTTPANWGGDAPAPTDSLTFSGSTQTTNNNDYTAGTNFGLITFSANGFSISGEALVLNGGITNSSGSQTFNPNITLGAAQEFANDGTSLILGGTITNAGYALTFSGSGSTAANGVISGGGGLIKSESGTLTLSGSNTYSGGTTISAGTLSVSAIDDTGTSNIGNSGTLLLNGGTLKYTGTGAADTARAIDNTVGVTSTIEISDSDANLDLSGQLKSTDSDNCYVNKTGSGTLTLSGTVDNRYHRLSVQAGTAVLGKTSSSSVHCANSIGGVSEGATLQLSGTGNDQIFNGGTGTVNGRVNDMDGTFDFNGRNEDFNILNGGSGTFLNNSSGTTSTLTIGAPNGVSTFEGAIIDHTEGTGIMSLVKSGTGTMTLSGANTYSGTTTVSGGTLAVSGSIDNSHMTVNSGAVVKGSGTIDNLTLSGTVAPGNSVGTLNADDGVTWADGGIYEWEINDASGTTGVDPGWDLLNITGALSITASTFTIKIISLDGTDPGSCSNFSELGNYSWKITSASSGITGFGDIFTLNRDSFANTALGDFTVRKDGSNDIYIDFAGVPEPSVFGLFGLGLFGLLFAGRKRFFGGKS